MRLLAICLIGLVCAQFAAAATCGESTGQLDKQLPNNDVVIKITTVPSDPEAGCTGVTIKLKCTEMDTPKTSPDTAAITLTGLKAQKYTNCEVTLHDAAGDAVTTAKPFEFTVVGKCGVSTGKLEKQLPNNKVEIKIATTPTPPAVKCEGQRVTLKCAEMDKDVTGTDTGAITLTDLKVQKYTKCHVTLHDAANIAVTTSTEFGFTVVEQITVERDQSKLILKFNKNPGVTIFNKFTYSIADGKQDQPITSGTPITISGLKPCAKQDITIKGVKGSDPPVTIEEHTVYTTGPAPSNFKNKMGIFGGTYEFTVAKVSGCDRERVGVECKDIDNEIDPIEKDNNFVVDLGTTKQNHEYECEIKVYYEESAIDHSTPTKIQTKPAITTQKVTTDAIELKFNADHNYANSKFTYTFIDDTKQPPLASGGVIKGSKLMACKSYELKVYVDGKEDAIVEEQKRTFGPYPTTKNVEGMFKWGLKLEIPSPTNSECDVQEASLLCEDINASAEPLDFDSTTKKAEIHFTDLQPDFLYNCVPTITYIGDFEMERAADPITFKTNGAVIFPDPKPNEISFTFNYDGPTYTKYAYNFNDAPKSSTMKLNQKITKADLTACHTYMLEFFGVTKDGEEQLIYSTEKAPAPAIVKVTQSDKEGTFKKDLIITIENPGECVVDDATIDCGDAQKEITFDKNKANVELTDLKPGNDYKCTIDVNYNNGDFSLKDLPVTVSTLPAVIFGKPTATSINFVFTYDGTKKYTSYEYQIDEEKAVKTTSGKSVTVTNRKACVEYDLVVTGFNEHGSEKIATVKTRTIGAQPVVNKQKDGAFIHQLKVDIANAGECKVTDGASIECSDSDGVIDLDHELKFSAANSAEVKFEDLVPRKKFNCDINMMYDGGFVMPEVNPYLFETSEGIVASTNTPASIEFRFAYDGDAKKYINFTYTHNDAEKPVKLSANKLVTINGLKTCEPNKIVVKGFERDTGNTKLDEVEIRTMAAAPTFIEETQGAFFYETKISAEHIAECDVESVTLACPFLDEVTAEFENGKANILLDSLKPQVTRACPVNVQYGQDVTPPKEAITVLVQTKSAIELKATKPGEITIEWTYDGKKEEIFEQMEIVDGENSINASFSDNSIVMKNRVACRVYRFEVFALASPNNVFFGNVSINAMSAAPNKPQNVEVTIPGTDSKFKIQLNRTAYDCELTEVKVDCGDIKQNFKLKADTKEGEEVVNEVEVEMKGLKGKADYKCKVTVLNANKEESPAYEVSFRTSGVGFAGSSITMLCFGFFIVMLRQ